MTENCILDGFASSDLVEKINSSPAKKLIQELNFKYGLKVLTTNQLPEIYARRPLEFMMCLPDSGFAIAKVWATEDSEGVEYNYRSPYYSKERGSGREERETIHSKKLSSLMATLKRNNVVRDTPFLLSYTIAPVMDSIENLVKQQFGSVHKSHNLDSEQVHNILKALLGVSPNKVDLNNCKELLDKLDRVDRMKEESRIEVNRFLGKELLMVGADKFDHLVVGSVRKYRDASEKYDIIKPFKRYRSVHQREDLLPMLTMLKVHTEEKYASKGFYGNFIPRGSELLKDLDMVVCAHRQPDEFNMQWVAIPC